LALVLYDFILWDEKPGLDIKIADITAAQNIFKAQTAKSPVSEKLIGGFKDNASYEIFQFFNVEFNREGFHAFCLERWKEFLLEWELGLLKLLVYRIAEDFHPNTYRNNPVLEEYLEIYQGFRKTIAESTNKESLSVDEEDDDLTESLEEYLNKKEESDENEEELEIEEYPYSIDEVNKTVEMSIFHQVLFLILYVGGKTENHTDEEIADATGTAQTIAIDWLDKDEALGREVLEETFEVLQKCGEVFTAEELANIADECCFYIHDNVTNADEQEDIIRFITDQANADGELDLWEETIIDSWSLKITIGRGWGN
jgi:hypothetical protein